MAAIKWFRATDLPKREHSPYKNLDISSMKSPTVWEPFSAFDSELIEQQYQSCSNQSDLSSIVILTTSHDGLYEVDVKLFEYIPIYWDGSVYEVRRGLWFEMSGIGGTYSPCEGNLTRQIEDGYNRNFELREVDVKEEVKFEKVRRYALFGPYMNKFVHYESLTVAHIQSDELSSKLSRAVLMTSGEKVIRGWSEVVKLKRKTKKEKSKSKVESDLSLNENENDENDHTQTPLKNDLSADEKLQNSLGTSKDIKRDINHVIFTVHGIGQKLSQHVEAMSFIHDCDVLRSALVEAANILRAPLSLINQPQNEKIPVDGGIQILPIQWRHKMDIAVMAPKDECADGESEDRELRLEDILPEGIPGIRLLVSDVILDVLLYMTPKYRQEMITAVSSEINRVHNIYMQRNPQYTGTFSIYGHSLGSVISYDIATHQTLDKIFTNESKSSPTPNSEIDISDFRRSSMSQATNHGLIDPSMNMKSEKLDFQIDHLFTVGSPIGMFLLLAANAIRPTLRDDEEETDPRSSRPAVKALYNIFHPYDPVAHRLEPLFSHRLSTLKPMPIHYSKGGLTQTVKGIGAASTEMVTRGRSLISGFFTSANTVMSTLTKFGSHHEKKTDLEMSKDAEMVISTSKSPDRRSSFALGDSSSSPERRNSIMSAKSINRVAPNAAQQSSILKLKALNPHGRLDFVLQESLLENPYLSSLGVHVLIY